MKGMSWKTTRIFHNILPNAPTVKSDRINAIRKQYDAFLEDDKKRKERNEYILEKLDKMRYCTAMVQVRQKPPFNDNRKILCNMTPQALDIPTNINLDMKRSQANENVLLQEISKKYILIPKLRSTYADELTKQIEPKHKVDENADWKSKYDILEKLKRDEKGQDASIPQEACVIEANEPPVLNKYAKENDLVYDDEPFHEYKDELPVKLTPESEMAYASQNYYKDDAGEEQNFIYGNELSHTVDNIHQNKTEDIGYGANDNQNIDYQQTFQNSAPYNDILENINDGGNNIESSVNGQQNLADTDYDQIPSKDNTEYLKIDENKYNADNYGTKEDVESMNQLAPSENTIPAEMYTALNNEAVEELTVTSDPVDNEELVLKEEENNNTVDPHMQSYLNQAEIVSVPEYNASENINEINNELPAGNNTSMLAANEEYPVVTTNVQDLNPQDGVQLQDNENVNLAPEIQGSDNATYDPVVIDNENAPVESDAFYNDQTGTYDYTTEGVENYNAEYAPQTENYQQNEEYAYYEGAQQEQPYTEINEQEETTQQYDQNYEQQYGSEYDQQAYQQQEYQQEYPQGYEQQDYAQPEQQYEEVDQTQQDLQYENQDPTSQQYVEQQLDNEEGYVAEPNETNEGEQQIPAAVENVATVQ